MIRTLFYVALLALGCAGNPLDPSANASDADGDGIQDSLDACPSEPETVNGYQDGDGCPDLAALEGSWVGTMTLALPSQPPVRRDGGMRVTYTGTGAVVAGICVGAEAVVAATGGPTILTATGPFVCPPTVIGACDTAQLTLSSLLWGIRADASLSFSASAKYIGCDETMDGTLLFDGARR